MKYKNFTLGQIEAIINKLGGEQGAKDFLAGQVEIAEKPVFVKKGLEIKSTFPQFGKDILKGKGSFTVPDDYNDDTFLDEFEKRTRDLKTTHYYNTNITSKNFSKVSNKLIPGKTYGIKLFPILKTVPSEQCLLAFLKEQGAVLVGAQGLFALQESQPEIFQEDKWTLSFDEKKVLPFIDGHHKVPGIRHCSDGTWDFDLSGLNRLWDSSLLLVCFCGLEE